MKNKITVFVLVLSFGFTACTFRQFRPQNKLGPQPYYEKLSEKDFPPSQKNGTKRQFALYLMKNFNRDALHIILNVQRMRKQYRIGFTSGGKKVDFMVYARGKGKNGVLKNIGTMVHEENHSYTSTYARRYLNKMGIRSYGGGYDAYYIDNHLTYIVRRGPTFPARLIKDIFPKHMLKKRMHHFRYDTYVYPSTKYQSTQVHGVYGLLDELNAYYHGCRAQLLLLDYYKSQKTNIGKNFAQYFSGINGTRFAYGEFKLFILLYFIKAKQSFPRVYNSMLNNLPLIEAFLKVESNYKNLLIEYERIKKGLKIWLRLHKYKLEESKTSIFIKRTDIRSSTNYGYGNFNETLAIYQKEMQKKKYQDMMSLLIKRRVYLKRKHREKHKVIKK